MSFVSIATAGRRAQAGANPSALPPSRGAALPLISRVPGEAVNNSFFNRVIEPTKKPVSTPVVVPPSFPAQTGVNNSVSNLLSSAIAAPVPLAPPTPVQPGVVGSAVRSEVPGGGAKRTLRQRLRDVNKTRTPNAPSTPTSMFPAIIPDVSTTLPVSEFNLPLTRGLSNINLTNSLPVSIA